jgi:phosphonate transport system permease protein
VTPASGDRAKPRASGFLPEYSDTERGFRDGAMCRDAASSTAPGRRSLDRPAAARNGRAHVSSSPVFQLRRAAIAAAAVAAVIASCVVSEVRPAALLDPAARAAVGDFVRGLFPPDLSPGFAWIVAIAAVRTIAIAVVGTALSVIVGLPLAFLGTATLFRRGPLVEGSPPSAGGRLLAGASAAARAVLGGLRAVPDLVWAMFFVVGVGLGPTAGVLALGVSYGGVLGRVLAQLFEDVDPRPLEALLATGATRTQIFVFGIWPQARPGAVAYALYSVECCMRAAAVLGLVGAGGIGYEIALSMRMFEYRQIATLVAALLALVWLGDACSAALRRALRANAPPGMLGHRPSRPGRTRPRGALALALVAATAGACAAALWDADAFDTAAVSHMARFARGLFPPELDPGYLRTLVRPAAQTLGISVIGTLVGALVGGGLGVAAAAAYSEDDRARGAAGLARAGLRRLSRTALSLMRAIPELLWVLVFIIAVGLGPFAGALALGIHTGGVLGKLYADTLEEVSPLPLRGLRATGATPLQLLVWGAWPEARRTLVSYTVLRWEMNLRTSTVVGLAGGGGIGVELYNSVQLGFYPRVAVLILVVGAMIAATEWIGDRIRRRLDAAAQHTRRAPRRAAAIAELATPPCG